MGNEYLRAEPCGKYLQYCTYMSRHVGNYNTVWYITQNYFVIKRKVESKFSKVVSGISAGKIA